MIIIDLQDVKNKMDVLNIDGKLQEFTSILLNIKIVKRNKDEEMFYTNDSVIENGIGNLPKISEATRRDIFNFYNIMFTNRFNTYLKSSCDKLEIKGKSINIGSIDITDYNNDIKDIISLANKHKSLENAIDNISIYEATDNDTEEIIAFTDNLDFKVESEYLPLVYVDKFNFIRVPILKLENKLFNSGAVMELVDSNLLGIDITSLNKNIPNIILDNDSEDILYIRYIGKTFTIRKISYKEIFATTLI